MIRLIRRLGRFPAGTVTDYFDAAAEAAFLLDGTAEPVADVAAEGRAEELAQAADAAPDYSHMKKDDLLQLAMVRSLDVSPRAKVAEIIEALETSDDA